MSYGLPCPSQPDPMTVFSSVEEFDTSLSQFVEAIMSALASQQAQSSAALAVATDALQRRVVTWLKEINGILGNVYTALSTMINSQVFVMNTQLATTVSSIATSLETTTREVMDESFQPQQPAADYPPSTLPDQGPLPYLSPQGMPAGTNPESGLLSVLPLASTAGFPAQPANARQTRRNELAPTTSEPTTLIMDGLPVTVFQVCSPIQNSAPVNVAGFNYLPTLTILNTGGDITTGRDGSPIINVGYDRQPDGSLVVSIGPLHVHVSLPPADKSSGGQACPLVPLLNQ